MLRRRLKDDEKLVGKKIGLTVKAVQQMVGVDEPDFGFLTDAMQFEDGESVTIAQSMMTPMVEERPGGWKDTLKWNVGYNLAAGLPPSYPPGTLEKIRSEVKGSLIAWEPVKQEARWTVPYAKPFNGGVLITETNLLFQGDSMGTFHAYDAATGKELWSMNLKSGIQAAPVTYEIDGEQYVAIATGWGASWALDWGFAWDKPTAPDVGRVFAFKLGAKGQVPDLRWSAVTANSEL